MKQEGVVIAQVVDTNDPHGEGRIGITFPWLPGGDMLPTVYAPVATPLAGPNSGMFFQPEKNDEVLCAFEQNDMAHPMIIGFLWNGKDRPPETDPSNRVILTPGGHTLRFEDGEGERIIVRSKGGQEIVLDKDSIRLKGGGRQITMKSGKIEFN